MHNYKKLKVEIYCDKVEVLKSDFDKMEEVSIDNKAFLKIVLSNISCQRKIVKGKKINLKINLYKDQSDYLNLVLKDFYKIKEKIVFLSFFDKDSYNGFEDYSIFGYSIFESWLNNKKINWIDFKTELEKEAWIRCCGRLIDLRNQKIKLSKFIINFEYINSLNDFYCLIGEIFFGYKGYIGGDFNAFSDCLYYINKNSNIKEAIICFKNFQLININFKNFPLTIEFFRNDIITELQNNGFVIKFV